MATKKPTPAQLAARARFAEMARSGAFKRKAKRKKNPLDEAGGRYEILWAGSGDLKASYDDLGQAKDFLDDIDRPPGLFYGRDTKTGKHFFSFAAQTKALKRNPARKTVSQKISQLVREGYPQKQAVAVALSEQRKGKVKRNPATGRKGSRTKLNPAPAKRQRMLNISWLTPGGEREIKSVPIEFTFTHYVGNVAEKFFVRNEGGQLIVSEYTTGGKVGQVPYSMRAAALNDREAAKRFLGEMLSRIGADRFRAAVSKFSPIN